MKRFILAAVFSLAALPALACQFNTDCAVGSQCMKSTGQIYGVCTGGMNPGNSNDRKPVRDMLNPSKKTGNTCNFDTQCGIGSTCIKEDGQIKGVCG